jgi:hypothetical protein
MIRRSSSLACAVFLGLFLIFLTGLADARGRKAPGGARGKPVRSLKVKAKAQKPRVSFDPNWQNHPSARYAALSAAKCLEEVKQRAIEIEPVANAPGVLAPVRLPKDVDGVVYRTQAPDHLRAKSPFDVFDCRLVLSLSDFSKILKAHDIDEVLMFSAWRPPSKTWPEGKLGTRHPGALAIDAFRLGKKLAEGQSQKDRVWLDVERDWAGAIGATSCGQGAAPPVAKSPAGESAAKKLRAIVCEAAEKHIFTSMLTPNYNRAHRNHFHLEVTPEVTWHLVR